jgi:RHS repeat-associated protein
VSIRSASQVWSFPNLHGDDIVTTNGSGARTGVIAIYDPFGDPINLTTGLIGTLTANSQDLANTTTPGATFGWEGSHGKQDQHTGDIATIEMGARQYVPLLGRFLSCNSVAGGNSNDYNYPNDPINDNDISGDLSADSAEHYAIKGYSISDIGGRLSATRPKVSDVTCGLRTFHGTYCEVTGVIQSHDRSGIAGSIMSHAGQARQAAGISLISLEVGVAAVPTCAGVGVLGFPRRV